MIARTGWAQGRVAGLLSDTATLIRVTLVDEEGGGQVRTETTVGTYPFRMQTSVPITGARAGADQTVADRIATISERVGFFPYGTVVQNTDSVLHQGTRYEVVATVSDRTDSVTVGVLLKRVA